MFGEFVSRILMIFLSPEDASLFALSSPSFPFLFLVLGMAVAISESCHRLQVKMEFRMLSSERYTNLVKKKKTLSAQSYPHS